jgi:hypothetical protein
MRTLGGHLAASFLLLGLLATHVGAQEGGDGRQRGSGDVSLWVGHVSSDNVSRTPNGDEGSYQTLGVSSSLANTSTRFEGEMYADLEFRTYSEQGLEDEVVGNFNGSATIGIVPDRFTWLFREVYSQAPTDLFAPVGPANREGLNVFSTGPELDISFGGRTGLRMSSIWMNRQYGQSVALDSDSLSSEVALYRDVSPTTTLGIVGGKTETEYDDSSVLPYDIESLRLSYEKMLASGGVVLEVGRDEVTIADQTTDGPLFNFAWTRAVTARGTLRIGAGRGFTDSGALLEARPDDLVNSEQDIVLSVYPTEQERVEALYTWMLDRSDVSLGYAKTQDSFIGDDTLDNQADTAILRVSHAMTPRLDIGFFFEEIRRDLTEIQQEDRDTTLTAFLNRQFSSRLDLYLSATQYERRGTDDMDERRYEIRLVYSPTR